MWSWHIYICIIIAAAISGIIIKTHSIALSHLDFLEPFQSYESCVGQFYPNWWCMRVPKQNELENLLAQREYDFIGISSANNFMIENINNLSTNIANFVEKKTPIVLGGNLVNTYKQTNGKLKVDFITQNLEQILNQLSLKYKKVI